MNEELGTVVSTFEGPTTLIFSFVLSSNTVRKGQYVKVETEDGILIGSISDITRANRYFERAESVAEYERNGSSLIDSFPTTDWEYTVANCRAMGIYNKDNLLVRNVFPPSPGSKVLAVEDERIKTLLGFDDKGMNIGRLSAHSVDAKINLNRLLQKHFAILAMSGAGKCAGFETPVILSSGKSEKLGALVEDAFAKSSKKWQEEDTEFATPGKPLELVSISEDFKTATSRVRAVTRRPAPKKLLRIRTNSGRFVEVTAEHPLMRMTTNGPEWVQASKINKTDSLAVPRQIPRSSQLKEIDISKFYTSSSDMLITSNSIRSSRSRKAVKSKLELSYDLGKFVGFLMGDGHAKGDLMAFSSIVPETKEEFCRLAETLFGLKSTTYPTDVRVYSRTLVRVLSDVFGVRSSTKEKTITETIFCANDEFVKGFLSAFFDCDGYASKTKPELELVSASKSLAQGTSRLLLSFGILSRLKAKHNKKYDRDYFHIHISGTENLSAFKDSINFGNSKKRLRLESFCNLTPNTNLDVIPNMSHNLSRILDNLQISESEVCRRAGLSQTVFARYNKGLDSMSRTSLQKICRALDSRAKEILAAHAAISAAKIPSTCPQDVLSKVSALSSNYEYKQIASNCSISSATVGRMLSERTAPTKNVLDVCGALASMSHDQELGEIKSGYDDFSSAWPSERLCATAKSLGLSYEELDCDSNLHTGAWASFARGEREADAFHIAKMAIGLLKQLDSVKVKLQETLPLLDQAHNLAESSVLWDKITEIEEVDYQYPFVYDLALEGAHNFLAGEFPMLIHNSYLSGVIIEEILDRPKEMGRPAIIVVDVHGEYIGFAERGSGYADRSTLIDGKKIRIGVPSVTPSTLCEYLPTLSDAGKRELSRIVENVHKEKKLEQQPYDLNDIVAAVDNDFILKDNTKAPIIGALLHLKSLHLFSKGTYPALKDLARPGKLAILDLSGIDDARRKQVIVAFFGRKLFKARKKEKIPPFLFMIEESHNFAREKAKSSEYFAKSIIETIAREGRKFGASLCLISQRPVQLSTTALSQANTHIIMRVTNPYDIDHIGESCEGIDKSMLGAITTLRTGEAMIVGEAANFPVFVGVRKRKSFKTQRGESIESLSRKFEEANEKKKQDVEAFL